MRARCNPHSTVIQNIRRKCCNEPETENFNMIRRTETSRIKECKTTRLDIKNKRELVSFNHQKAQPLRIIWNRKKKTRWDLYSVTEWMRLEETSGGSFGPTYMLKLMYKSFPSKEDRESEDYHFSVL